MTLDTGSRSCAETKLISKRWNCDIIIVVSVVTVVMKITLEICFNNGGGYGDLLVMVMVTVTDLVTIIWDKRIKLMGSEGAKVLCFFMGFFYLFIFIFIFFCVEE